MYTSESILDKLQYVQNRLACIVHNYGIRDHHAIDVLRELHWLPARSFITFKVAMLCFTAHHLGEPTYLKPLLHPYVPAPTLRSSDHGLLEWPALTTKTASQQFSYVASSAWLTCQSVRSSVSSGHFIGAPQNESVPSKFWLTGVLPVLPTLAATYGQ